MTTGCTHCRFFASIFPYYKQKSTYTWCLCEVHSVPKKKSCPYKQLLVAVRTRSQQLLHHRNNSVASAHTLTATVASPQQFSCQCAHAHSNCCITATIQLQCAHTHSNCCITATIQLQCAHAHSNCCITATIQLQCAHAHSNCCITATIQL